MHELSLCHSIYGIAERAAGGRCIGDIRLDIGELRQVIPETLEYCWGIVTDDTPLAGSRLVITRVPAVLACEECGAHTRLRGVPAMTCSGCGGIKVRVETGEEFLVRSLDVKD